VELVDERPAAIQSSPSELGYILGRLAGRAGVVALASFFYAVSRRKSVNEQNPGSERLRKKRYRRRRMT